MTDQEVILDLLDTLGEAVHRAVEGTSLDCLRWQRDAEANNIAVTLWHISRAFDLLKVRILEGRPPEEELWHVNVWATQTGYDPRGRGWNGVGNVSGYSQEEVAAVPILSANQLLIYFDQARTALGGYLVTLPNEYLTETVIMAFDVEDSAYSWVRNFLVDGWAHLGEIRAIKAMWERKAAHKGEEV